MQLMLAGAVHRTVAIRNLGREATIQGSPTSVVVLTISLDTRFPTWFLGIGRQQQQKMERV